MHHILKHAVKIQSISSTSWFILAMTMHPSVQRRAQEELDGIVGSDRLPDHEDLAFLPYVQAVLLEVLRWRPAVPLGIPHRVMVEDEYDGYRIPKGSMIIPVCVLILSCCIQSLDEFTTSPNRMNGEHYLMRNKF